MRVFKRGDFVEITNDGRTVDGVVTMASPNGKSLVVMFDAENEPDHWEVLPVKCDEDGCTALMTGRPVILTPKGRP